MLQEWGRCKGPYEDSKGSLRLRRQEACPLCDQFLLELRAGSLSGLHERRRNPGKALYESSVEVHKAQKCLHFADTFWLRPIDNGGYMIRLHFNPRICDDVT